MCNECPHPHYYLCFKCKSSGVHSHHSFHKREIKGVSLTAVIDACGAAGQYYSTIAAINSKRLTIHPKIYQISVFVPCSYNEKSWTRPYKGG